MLLYALQEDLEYYIIIHCPNYITIGNLFLLLLIDSMISSQRVSLGISISVIYSVYNCKNCG